MTNFDDVHQAAMSLGRMIASGDDSWLYWVQVGQLQAMESRPDQSAGELCLEVLRGNHSLRTFLDGQISRTVNAARRERVSWSEIGEVVGVSKQTAHSRWGDVIETRDGEHFVMDIMREREVPLARISANTPHRPIPDDLVVAVAVAEHRAYILGALPAPEMSADDADLVVRALVILARNLTTASGSDWNDPDEQQHFLDLALHMGGSDASTQ